MSETTDFTVLYKEKTGNKNESKLGQRIAGNISEATTTITLPITGYYTKVMPLPHIKTKEELFKEASFGATVDTDDINSYMDHYMKDIEEYGEIANRFIHESLGIAEIRKFDVDMDGKDETIITQCSYMANGCPHQFTIIKNNKVVFSADQGGRRLGLEEVEDGDGFYLYWTPIVGSEEETSYCCPTAEMKTRFIYEKGKFQAFTEQKISN